MRHRARELWITSWLLMVTRVARRMFLIFLRARIRIKRSLVHWFRLMRVLFNIMMLAFPLYLSSIGCFALPLPNNHNFEIRGTSVKKFAKAISNVIREKILIGYSFIQDASAETLTASTTSIGEGAVLVHVPSDWFGSTCAVYADKKKFQNVPKLFVDDIHVMTATLPQILQEQSQAPEQKEYATTTSASSLTKETTILFYRMLGSPRGNLQMLIPPYYFKSSQPSNDNRKLDISLKCVPRSQYKATKKFPTGIVEWDKWNVLNWPQELKLTV
ncbi:hypothetical protein DFJ43DRAFT_300634 [Lentinula guzmanii]|uniref:Uncharacterized protein n=1 Tax=Lentinula guzmanii TaxID=2804957 RepID=A0AA38N1J3_9AGAR|nr:hypothetical protein DFJ43DRAFT_300634 [Lentinula guzmanii]